MNSRNDGGFCGSPSIAPIKSCRLINGKFSWQLLVDGKKICFNGSDSADYFCQHYRGLGYEVSMEDDND